MTQHTEAEDFRLLIKQSYAPSYAKNGDKPLDKATLIRVAGIANAYEFHDAVNECLTAAADGLSFEEAFTCMNDVPENLKGTDAIDVLMDKIALVWINGMNGPSSIGTEEGEAKTKLIKESTDIFAANLGYELHELAVGDVSKVLSFNDSLVLTIFWHVSLASLLHSAV